MSAHVRNQRCPYHIKQLAAVAFADWLSTCTETLSSRGSTGPRHHACLRSCSHPLPSPKPSIIPLKPSTAACTRSPYADDHTWDPAPMHAGTNTTHNETRTRRQCPMAWPASLGGRIMGLDGKLGRLCSTPSDLSAILVARPWRSLKQEIAAGLLRCVRRRSSATPRHADQSTAPGYETNVCQAPPSCRCLHAVSGRH